MTYGVVFDERHPLIAPTGVELRRLKAVRSKKDQAAALLARMTLDRGQ
jgi:hypothetical protein